MQRWVRLPQGGFLDAAHVMYIGKIESYARVDDEGHSSGLDYAVAIGTNLNRDQHLLITGSKEEIGTLVRQILGQPTAS
jgi:hypothetical protein